LAIIYCSYKKEKIFNLQFCILLIFGLILFLFVTYSFPSQQYFYGLKNKNAAAVDMSINESSKSVTPKNDDKSENIAELYNNDVTIIPMGVNSMFF
jgi:hypothetical protein